MAPSSANMVKGVCISSNPDVDRGAKKYFTVEVATDDPVFNDYLNSTNSSSFQPTPYCPLSPLSELVGLPFRIRRFTPPRPLPGTAVEDLQELQDQIFYNRYSNVEGITLLITMEPRSDRWNYPPSFWSGGAGTVLLTSVGDKVITPQQVEALCAYSSYLSCGPMMERQPQSESGGKDQMLQRRQKVINEVTPAKFREFYEYYKSITRKEGQCWEWDDDAGRITNDPSVSTEATSGGPTAGVSGVCFQRSGYGRHLWESFQSSIEVTPERH